MYAKIRSMDTPPTQYEQQLISEGVIGTEDAAKLRKAIEDHFEQEYQASLQVKPELKNTMSASYRGSRSLTHKWKGMSFSQDGSEPE